MLRITDLFQVGRVIGIFWSCIGFGCEEGIILRENIDEQLDLFYNCWSMGLFVIGK